MSLFTTRVELHGATEKSDYDKLHKAMEDKGFWRTISLQGEETVYHLPTAEYNYSSDTQTTEQVLGLAKTAAATTGKKAAILVTKVADRRYWDGLTLVK